MTTTKDRVSLAGSVNCGGVEPEDAWRVMFDTWAKRTALKREAGVDLRGADNKNPVMHYTLSWEPGQQPGQDLMKQAVLESLKALGLERHQAAYAVHNDKDHMHVHVIVNTVNPENGKTAPLKFSALELQKWEKEFSRQHQLERVNGSNFLLPEDEPKRRELPHTKLPRQHAIEYSAIAKRIALHEAQFDHRHRVERSALASVHRMERYDLEWQTREAAFRSISHVHERFVPAWREIYKAQDKEARHLIAIQGNPLERALFVHRNKSRLARGKPLTRKQIHNLIKSPTELFKAMRGVHRRERRDLAALEREEVRPALDRIWTTHEQRADRLYSQQLSQEQSIRAEQLAEKQAGVSHRRAEAELLAEQAENLTNSADARTSPHFLTDAAQLRRQISAQDAREPDSVQEPVREPSRVGRRRLDQRRDSHDDWFSRRRDESDNER